jgi:hypothetical protein
MKRLGRAVWPVLAALYFVCIWIDGAGSSIPFKVLPGTVAYFVGIAGLFPRAATATTEYRVEAWVCKDKRWEELDYRVYFPLHADDKESRFHRILYFYRKDTDTMESLDDWLVDAHNDGKHADGVTQGETIGGVRFVSLRIPIPPPGTPITRFRHRSLTDYPKGYRHTVYRTEQSFIDERCGEAAAPEPEKIEQDKPDLFDNRKSEY